MSNIKERDLDTLKSLGVKDFFRVVTSNGNNSIIMKEVVDGEEVSEMQDDDFIKISTSQGDKKITLANLKKLLK